jgi:5-methylcytosine-specific restriction enzyme A
MNPRTRNRRPILTGNRESKFSHLYRTTRWRKLRAAHLNAHPLCKFCEQEGRVTPAAIVDHITPHRGDMDKFWAGPFQSLCATCHNRHKKMQEHGGQLMGCTADGVPMDEGHWWNK